MNTTENDTLATWNNSINKNKLIFVEHEINELLDADYINLKFLNNKGEKSNPSYMIAEGHKLLITVFVKQAIRLLQAYDFLIREIGISDIVINEVSQSSYNIYFIILDSRNNKFKINIKQINDKIVYNKNYDSSATDKLSLMLNIIFDQSLESKEIVIIPDNQ